MLERRISPGEVRVVIEAGEIVEGYPDDQPFPAYLVLGFVAARGGQPLHVVLGYNVATDTGYVVTAYVPSSTVWQPDWKTRR